MFLATEELFFKGDSPEIQPFVTFSYALNVNAELDHFNKFEAEFLKRHGL